MARRRADGQRARDTHLDNKLRELLVALVDEDTAALFLQETKEQAVPYVGWHCSNAQIPRIPTSPATVSALCHC